MTREEREKALETLKNEWGFEVISDDAQKALDMALKALSAEPCEDAISRQAVEEIINDIRDCISVEGYWAILERMKKLPPVKPQEPKTECSCDQIKWERDTAIAQLKELGYGLGEKPKTGWIPLKTRPMTDEESTYYRDWAEYGAEIFDCPLPDDGQEVLISWGGSVCVDAFVKDDSDGCYFEGVEIDDVDAWQPLPEPYKAESEK